MRLTANQVADHFGLSITRSKALIKLGMPTSSIAEATAWRNARMLRAKGGSTDKRTEAAASLSVDIGEVDPDDSFEQTVERHRELKEASRLRFVAAAEAGEPSQKKLYEIYQNVVKTLVTLEREALARRIDSKKLVESAMALERFWNVLSEIKADMQSFGLEVATKANPDNPQIALAACNGKADKLLDKWSKLAEAADAEMSEQEVKEADAPDLSSLDIAEEPTAE